MRYIIKTIQTLFGLSILVAYLKFPEYITFAEAVLLLLFLIFTNIQGIRHDPKE